MASNLSDYLGDALLGWVKGTDMDAAPASIYAALYDGDPGTDGTGGTDVTDTISSGRAVIALGAVSARAVANSSVVDFGTAIAGATADHVAIWDAATGGNCLFTGALASSKTITTGAPVSFPIGNITLSIA